jgi:hypothetical protein
MTNIYIDECKENYEMKILNYKIKFKVLSCS